MILNKNDIFCLQDSKEVSILFELWKESKNSYIIYVNVKYLKCLFTKLLTVNQLYFETIVLKH